MLVAEKDIQIRMLYIGPGKGCHKVLRCDLLEFAEPIDDKDELASKSGLLESLDRIAYEKFIEGTFSFEPGHHERACFISNLSDLDLIEAAFPANKFELTFTRFELQRRNLFDTDLYRLGLYSDGSTKRQAIHLLKQRARESPSPQGHKEE